MSRNRLIVEDILREVGNNKKVLILSEQKITARQYHPAMKKSNLGVEMAAKTLICFLFFDSFDIFSGLSIYQNNIILIYKKRRIHFHSGFNDNRFISALSSIAFN